MNDIAIARDRIEITMPSASRRHAGHDIAHRLDFGHRIVQPQRATQPLEMRNHPCDQTIRAALRKPDAAILFQLVDQRIDRARRHRVAAH